MSTAADLMGLGMSPALASRLGNTPATIAGVGTSGTTTATIAVPVAVLTCTATAYAFILGSGLSEGRPVWLWNTSAAYDAVIYPPSGGTINGAAANAPIFLSPLSGAVLQLYSGVGITTETWGANFSSGGGGGGGNTGAGNAFIYVQAAITLASQTAAQPAFVGTSGGILTNGEITLPIGTFMFDSSFNLSGISATSGGFGFSITAGTPAVIGQQSWEAYANKATLATPVAWQSSWNVAANTELVTATTATVGFARIRGSFTLTTAGPIIPNLSFTTITGSPTPIVGVGSYFAVSQLGNATVTTQGDWS